MPGCKSLLAGECGHSPLPWPKNRLQAGSYTNHLTTGRFTDEGGFR
jgi:hypothetical protein